MSNLNISRAQRLDQKVVELLPRLSRAFAAKLVERGKVTVNGEVETKPGYKLRANDVVYVGYDMTELEQIPDIDLPVIYEDDDCVVINKPVGVLSHSKGAFNPEATVATWLRTRLNNLLRDGPLAGIGKDSVGNGRAGIVHRLDRATSGVMICAKTPEALSWLQKQFSQRKVKKTYYAVVDRRMPHDHAMIDIPLARNPKKPQTFKADKAGKRALTEYFMREEGKNLTLLELKPQTGRTHQLRVHLSEIGHPIIGDTLYGGRPADRMYLHAEQLEITLPSRERKTFTAPLPSAFNEMLA